MMKYERLKENLQILDAHNHGQGKVINLTGGQKTESILLHEVISDCREILNKISQGTLIELPCKVGDTVYTNINGVGLQNAFTVSSVDLLGFSNGIYSWTWHQLGKSVFLTREEAEAKLKELQECSK